MSNQKDEKNCSEKKVFYETKRSDRRKKKQILKEGQLPVPLEKAPPHPEIEKKGQGVPGLQPITSKPSKDDTRPADQSPPKTDGNASKDGKKGR